MDEDDFFSSTRERNLRFVAGAITSARSTTTDIATEEVLVSVVIINR